MYADMFHIMFVHLILNVTLYTTKKLRFQKLEYKQMTESLFIGIKAIVPKPYHLPDPRLWQEQDICYGGVFKVLGGTDVGLEILTIIPIASHGRAKSATHNQIICCFALRSINLCTNSTFFLFFFFLFCLFVFATDP